MDILDRLDDVAERWIDSADRELIAAAALEIRRLRAILTRAERELRMQVIRANRDELRALGILLEAKNGNP